jgi:hypothetical protein
LTRWSRRRDDLIKIYGRSQLNTSSFISGGAAEDLEEEVEEADDEEDGGRIQGKVVALKTRIMVVEGDDDAEVEGEEGSERAIDAEEDNDNNVLDEEEGVEYEHENMYMHTQEQDWGQTQTQAHTLGLSESIVQSTTATAPEAIAPSRQQE